MDDKEFKQQYLGTFVQDPLEKIMKHIGELGMKQSNGTCWNVYSAWKNGSRPTEECIIALIDSLVDQNREQLKHLIKQQKLMPHIIMKDDK